MDLHKRLSAMKGDTPIVPREEKVRETIRLAQEICFSQEQAQMAAYREFLWSQLQYTRKRWWAMQAALLMLACQVIPAMERHYDRVRSVGVVGCLFVVLMIPELWRNQESESTQVEAACLYSLRQIYAARITLFGMVDVALLSLFVPGLGRMGFTLVEVMSQFLLPTAVTGILCFRLLCGRRNWSESFSMAACLVWGAAWWLLVMNEALYARIVPGVWMVLLAVALAFLALAVRRAVQGANQYWEVEFV